MLKFRPVKWLAKNAFKFNTDRQIVDTFSCEKIISGVKGQRITLPRGPWHALRKPLEIDSQYTEAPEEYHITYSPYIHLLSKFRSSRPKIGNSTRTWSSYSWEFGLDKNTFHRSQDSLGPESERAYHLEDRWAWVGRGEWGRKNDEHVWHQPRIQLSVDFWSWTKSRDSDMFHYGTLQYAVWLKMKSMFTLCMCVFKCVNRLYKSLVVVNLIYCAEV